MNHTMTYAHKYTAAYFRRGGIMSTGHHSSKDNSPEPLRMC